MARRTHRLGANTADDVLEPIDVALAPINVHLAMFPSALSQRVIRHGQIIFTVHATSPSFTVGFCGGIGSRLHGCGLQADSVPALSLGAAYGVLSRRAVSPLWFGMFPADHVGLNGKAARWHDNGSSQ